MLGQAVHREGKQRQQAVRAKANPSPHSYEYEAGYRGDDAEWVDGELSGWNQQKERSSVSQNTAETDGMYEELAHRHSLEGDFFPQSDDHSFT